MNHFVLALVLLLASSLEVDADPPTIITNTEVTGAPGSTFDTTCSPTFAIGIVPRCGRWSEIFTGPLNFTSGEVFGLGVAVEHTPTAAVVYGTAPFAIVANSTCDGSYDNSAGLLCYGGQFEVFAAGSASMLGAYGAEMNVVVLTTGHIVEANGTWSHIDNESTGTADTANALKVGVSNTGGGHNTNANGIYITNIYGDQTAGINILAQTACSMSPCYALKTSLGRVSFGDRVDMPVGASVNMVYGPATWFGDGTNETLGVQCVANQGPWCVVVKDGSNIIFGITGSNGIVIGGQLAPPGMQIGSPTGGYKGVGTINVQAGGYWADGTQGVACAAGTVNFATLTVKNGLITHC